MLTVSDVLKAIEALPVWKSFLDMRKRLAQLESRVAALESGQSSRRGPEATQCPKCHATMVVMKEQSHPLLGDLVGMKIHSMRCDACGEETEREFDPRKGYSA